VKVEFAMYRVEVDSAPAYELGMSLMAFLSREDQRILELGPGWVKHVREQLHPDLLAELAGSWDQHCVFQVPIDLLVWRCPADRDAAGFLRWFGALSAGALYEQLAPYVRPEDTATLQNLGALQERYMRALTAWHEQYFRGIDPAILSGLDAEAVARRQQLETMAPTDVVETATCGVRLEPRPGLDTVLLVPQYHFRPWNSKSLWRGLRIMMYPADVLPPVPGEPPVGILRQARALSDESRLRILHFVATGPRSFTEIVQHTGLAKSTVHHHTVVLRAAGLVRIHDSGDASTTYSLRHGAIDELGSRLHAFVEGA
jgi:DNA-binding transcriptional ArsR family regulator